MTPTIDCCWFRLSHDYPPPDLEHLLSDDERSRADRLRMEQPRRVFTAARIALRLLLAEAVGRPPEALEFVPGDHGKPALVEGGGVGFNQSHSGSTVVIVLARTLELGVDVEEIDTRVRTLALARRFFDPTESRAVERLPAGPQRRRSFLHFWTAKEAVLKATGSGLTIPVRTVVISPDVDEPPRVIRFGGDTAEAGEWTLWRFEEPGMFMATVAARGAADHHLRVRRFSFC